MLSRLILSLTTIVALGWVAPSLQAQDPYASQFGYSLGYQNSFRNRLPTPPYFAIYPPVYYGKRFERPYGDSPYASLPQLGSAPDYYPVPKETPYRTRTVINPHADHLPGVQVQSEPKAIVLPRIGKTVEIVNPFAAEQIASQGK
jgi:hypothetical protein